MMQGGYRWGWDGVGRRELAGDWGLQQRGCAVDDGLRSRVYESSVWDCGCPAGSVWASGPYGYLVQFIGLGAPTSTPILPGNLGMRP